MEAIFKDEDRILLFNHFFPARINCGITTNFFGDCNYYRGGSDDYIWKLYKFLHATETFIPLPKNGTGIIWAQPDAANQRKDGDAVILRHSQFKNRRPLIFFPTGDCPIVLLHNKKINALVHCGWQGLKGKILTAVMSDLDSHNFLGKGETKAIIWPGICQDHYQIGEDVALHFPEDVIDNHLDLAQAVTRELLSLKFSIKDIAMPNTCSYHSQKNEEYLFASHRRKDTIRNVVFMSINLSA